MRRISDLQFLHMSITPKSISCRMPPSLCFVLNCLRPCPQTPPCTKELLKNYPWNCLLPISLRQQRLKLCMRITVIQSILFSVMQPQDANKGRTGSVPGSLLRLVPFLSSHWCISCGGNGVGHGAERATQLLFPRALFANSVRPRSSLYHTSGVEPAAQCPIKMT